MVSVDSAGVVRMTKRRFQNEWIQIADTRKVRDHTLSIEKTRPSRPKRCDVWIVERMRYPTD